MKLGPEYKRAQENMEPGIITADGFLGDDKRDIKTIITEDEERMEYLGLGYGEVTRMLKDLMEKGEAGLEEFITVDGKWLARTLEARGPLPCPFEDGIQRKITSEVINKNNNAKILFSAMSIHLLEVHHFHGGTGSPFRLEPDMLKKVLAG